MKSILIICLALMLAACATKSAYRSSGQALERELFELELRSADIILLGERHGAKEDHRSQAEILEMIPSASLGFEQVLQSQTESVEKYREYSDHDVDGLSALLNWKKSGWPDFKYYRPLFQIAWDKDWPILGLNQSLDDLKAPKGKAFKMLPKGEQQSLIQEMKDVHPFELSPEKVKLLAELQAQRDYAMASAMIEAVQNKAAPVVGIMGCGHVRKDRGLPFFVKALAPELRVLSLCFHPKAKQVDYVWRR